MRVTIGRFDPWTVDRAWAEARKVVVEGDGGRDPRFSRATVEGALAWHQDRMRTRGVSSVDMSDDDVRNGLADWLVRPLASVPRDDAIHISKNVVRRQLVEDQTEALVRTLLRRWPGWKAEGKRLPQEANKRRGSRGSRAPRLGAGGAVPWDYPRVPLADFLGKEQSR